MTSDLPGADTRAQVYLTVVGSADCSEPIPLGDGSADSELFLRGKQSTFDVTLNKIGQIVKLRLEHDGSNSDPAWHVDWVSNTEHL